jgi:hypothetical protein
MIWQQFRYALKIPVTIMRNRDLIRLKKLLEKDGFSVKRTGKNWDKSSFLYIKGNVSSAEVSPDNNGLWIEFWDSVDEESYDDSVKETTCLTVEDAYKVLISWLK